ncbi:unnamed protein product [Lactuca saligna]|uniref:Uncharacterized protein n=1 Tax=Lactuca saligna TaxID=75948 RepID=A0AA35Z4F3_LACSI|nr:unnamed protein product [Lactuca saligna]
MFFIWPSPSSFTSLYLSTLDATTPYFELEHKFQEIGLEGGEEKLSSEVVYKHKMAAKIVNEMQENDWFWGVILMVSLLLWSINMSFGLQQGAADAIVAAKTTAEVALGLVRLGKKE